MMTCNNYCKILKKMILPPHNTPFCQDCSCEKIKNCVTLRK